MKHFFNFIKKIKYKIFSPSKFYFGISLLWRGNSLEEINKFILFSIKKLFKPNFKKELEKNNNFLFNSARSAIAFSLKNFGIKKGDEIILSAFTCDAVSYAVKVIDAIPKYVDVNDDLTMNYNKIEQNINHKTKAIIIQNTFGRLGLSKKNISALKKKKLFIIVDDSLSYGSKLFGQRHSELGDVSIWTFEASKTVTIGWGGILKVNNKDLFYRFKESYKKLKKISILEDLRKFAQLWISLFFIENPILIGPFIWYFLNILGIYKGSNIQNKKSSKSIKKIGNLGHLLYTNLEKKQAHLFNVTRLNFIFYQQLLKSLDIKLIIEESGNEEIVSPRYPILVKESRINDLLDLSNDYKIEIGRWFKDLPDSRIINVKEDLKNTFKFNNTLINLPCYWTLKDREKNKINYFIKKCNDLNYFEKI